MDFRIFPCPVPEVCTPFRALADGGAYGRLLSGPRPPHRVYVRFHRNAISVEGTRLATVVGRLPDRSAVLAHLSSSQRASHAFVDYVSQHTVVPVFPFTVEESLVRTIIRQLITARQAHCLWGRFIDHFGVHADGLSGFPTLHRLRRIKEAELRHLGFGMKAHAIPAAIRSLNKQRNASAIPSVGPWSLAVMQAEMRRSYGHYPLWDKSGVAASRLCGVHLETLANTNRQLAGDLYIYGASFLEARRCL